MVFFGLLSRTIDVGGSGPSFVHFPFLVFSNAGCFPYDPGPGDALNKTAIDGVFLSFPPPCREAGPCFGFFNQAAPAPFKTGFFPSSPLTTPPALCPFAFVRGGDRSLLPLVLIRFFLSSGHYEPSPYLPFAKALSLGLFLFCPPLCPAWTTPLSPTRILGPVVDHRNFAANLQYPDPLFFATPSCQWPSFPPNPRVDDFL